MEPKISLDQTHWISSLIVSYLVTQANEVVLKDVSFQLSPGKSLGLLGRTGSGKSTITRLLFRLYEINQGQIRVGGKPIEEIRLEALRSQIGMVTQDVQLFNATVPREPNPL